MSGVNEIRSAFLDYFRKNGHEVVASSPLVPRNDPTLMFTNAGMVQFKNVFTGLEQRPYSRAATSQKCVRAGGKHNDLDNVGYTARHHTFFEMLGNFSFGDYFKERAIELAWNLHHQGVRPGDGQAAGHRLSHRRRGGRALEEDRRPSRRPASSASRPATISGRWAIPARADPARRSSTTTARTSGAALPAARTRTATASSRFWNLVFMQFEQVTKEERVDLPRPSIDTGMGLERIAAVLQGVTRQLRHRPFQASDPTPRQSATGVTAPRARIARAIPRHRRPSARLELPDRRRRAAVERRPRLCAAPHHAPRHAPRATARRRRAADVAAGAGAGARDGPGLSGTDARRER